MLGGPIAGHGFFKIARVKPPQDVFPAVGEGVAVNVDREVGHEICEKWQSQGLLCCSGPCLHPSYSQCAIVTQNAYFRSVKYAFICDW